jgi:hypothetical protein
MAYYLHDTFLKIVFPIVDFPLSRYRSRVVLDPENKTGISLFSSSSRPSNVSLLNHNVLTFFSTRSMYIKLFWWAINSCILINYFYNTSFFLFFNFREKSCGSNCLTCQRLNVICFIPGISPYRSVITFHHGYKNQSVKPCKAKVAVCSEIRTKHSIQSDHHLLEFLNVKPGGT